VSPRERVRMMRDRERDSDKRQERERERERRMEREGGREADREGRRAYVCVHYPYRLSARARALSLSLALFPREGERVCVDYTSTNLDGHTHQQAGNAKLKNTYATREELVCY
jgi:hypothetical protein